MTNESQNASDCSGWAGVRHILVPPDIVAVPRRSPVRARKQTRCRIQLDGEATTRGGGRDWFSDHLFVDPHRANAGAACGTSMTVHASCLVGLIVVLLTQSNPLPLVRVGPSLVMPAMVSTVPIVAAASPTAPVSTPERLAPKTATPSIAPPPPPPPPAAPAPAPAPVETPSSIGPETGHEGGAKGVEEGEPGGVDGGVAGGVIGGVVGGLLGGESGSGTGSTGPLRLGGGIEAPRKIKDVRPVYPPGALTDQARGAVVLEATVGIDGKVQDAKVIRSIPSLDRAALEAVQQWEFVPARLNGKVVAVIITVIVNFAIY